MLHTIVHNTTGLIHLISSLAALVFGTTILLNSKGTQRHKRIGYAYTISMIVLNVTAFMIFRLFNRFGPFHFAALISCLTLLAGMIPILLRSRFRSWLALHMSFMFYSVIGLYAAFASEVIVRVPGIRFWWSVTGATFLVFFVAMYFFRKSAKKWMIQFSKKSTV
ncbi:MAG: DUF2306 domain-containing protein [Flammeovirgaceae bacterium]|jgi:uncharacterized membrane protein|nr:DUF2306 domain-containing protein [Flammeovirgaceae bacterium]